MPSGADLELLKLQREAGVSPYFPQGYDGARLKQLADERGYRDVFELLQLFKDLPDGEVPGPPTGQSLDIYAIPDANRPKIISGKLSSSFSPGTAAGYTMAKLNDSVVQIGARWNFTPGTSGTAGIITWAIPISAAGVPDSNCHLAINENTWTYAVISGGVFTYIGSGTFDNPLSDSASVIHSCEVIIDKENSTAYIRLPDGTMATVTHALIKTLDCEYACIEEYRAGGANTLVEFTEWWADSKYSGDSLIDAKQDSLENGAWQNLTPVNGWVGFGSTYAPLQWRRESAQVGRVRGALKSGTTAALTNMFTLPFAPQFSVGIPVVVSGGTLGSVLLRGKADGVLAGQCQTLLVNAVQTIIDFTYPIGGY